MSFTLEMKLKRVERAFERVLGLVGRRGFELVAVEASRTENGAALAVRMTLESERSADLIVHQLAKLYEVEEVSIG